MIVVSDATPLIALAQIGQLPLLYELLGPVMIPQAVYTEVVDQGAGRSGAIEIASARWVQIKAITDATKVAYLLADLDKGEAEALVLAQEWKADWVLLDEIKARSIAIRLGLRAIGTVGLLLLAKKQGKIILLRPLLDQLRSRKFHLSDKVYNAVLQQADEL